MRIVFMGTPDFAIPSLKALAKEHQVLAVFSRPDSASGRGSALLPSPVKAAAIELGIPVECPKNLRGEECQALLRSYEADLFVVAAYGCILPKAVLDMPRYGCLNVHGSLLPRWRGAAPIQRAILAGDEFAGVCIMRMEEGLDTGDYCFSAQVPVGDKNTQQLTDELSQLGADLLLQAIASIEDGSIQWQVQDDSCTCYAAKIEKSELFLDPGLGAKCNLRMVQASSAMAPARALICGRPVTLLSVKAAEAALEPGEVSFAGKKVCIGAVDGSIQVLELKPDGKKAMPANAWRAGLKDVPMTWEKLV